MSSVATSPSIGVSPPRSNVIEIGPVQAWIAGGILAVILGAVFWDFWYTQVRVGIEEPSDWGHTLVIPFISAWFVWLRRDRLLAAPFRTAWTGLAVVIAGLGFYVLALIGPAIFTHHNLRGGAVAITMGGLCLLLCGWRACRWLWFPVVYWMVFGQAVSRQALELVTLRLQDWAATGAYYLLNSVGFETEIAGNVLTVIGADGHAHPLNVAEACSGMRMLVAFLALGVAMAFVGLDRWWQRVALVVMGVPIAIAVNIVRVATLGMLSLGNINLIEGEFHHFIGMVWLVPAFLMYLAVQWCLQVLSEPFVTPVAKPAPRPAAKPSSSSSSGRSDAAR